MGAVWQRESSEDTNCSAKVQYQQTMSPMGSCEGSRENFKGREEINEQKRLKRNKEQEKKL
ncbi:hypothetical protein C5167_039657 [Papaver somniferum]|uniref:Uncharacterized protein n=1 Tax=Papaver somniferum TaxID=3469 RepID=A0A4Y7ICX4_PAPSO|nr:hypothetical protein C5167_039657 [Papaver somniferum]